MGGLHTFFARAFMKIYQTVVYLAWLSTSLTLVCLWGIEWIRPGAVSHFIPLGYVFAIWVALLLLALFEKEWERAWRVVKGWLQ